MRSPRNRSRYLTEILERDPEELKTLLRDALWRNGGELADAARYLGVRYLVFWVYLDELGMNAEPKIIRNHLKSRYRVDVGCPGPTRTKTSTAETLKGDSLPSARGQRALSRRAG